MLGYKVVSHWVVQVDVWEFGQGRRPFRCVAIILISCKIPLIPCSEEEARKERTYEFWSGV